MSKKISIILLLFVVIIIGMATIVKAEDNSFSLDKTTLSIELNNSRLIFYKNEPKGETVVWTSSNPNVATVENGRVTGVSVGEAIITATAGSQTASCKVSVIYGSLEIEANAGDYINRINLVLKEHPVETLKAIVKDGNYEVVNNAVVTWTSSNNSVATVDSNGKITAVSVGSTNITVSVAGISKSLEVKVFEAPQFTDFSKAKYELLFDIHTDLKISDIKPSNNENNYYYYIITPNNTKPNVSFNTYGSVDAVTTKNAKHLGINNKENYIYAYDLDQYLELNQDLYLWVVQEVRLEDSYYDDAGNNIRYSAKFVVEGEKLTRPALPKLNLILKSFNIGKWDSKLGIDKHTNMNFRFPSAVEKRKFSIKIGKITDNSILQKIQKNDYSGITELLSYAKNNKSVYEANLTTTMKNDFSTNDILFDGRKLLQKDAYYYIYVKFDDENGKYYPIEGVTMGQAWFSTSSNSWNLYAYTDENFNWNNLSSTPSDSTPTKDTTIAKVELPNTGANIAIIISLLVLVGTIVTVKIKQSKYKGI